MEEKQLNPEAKKRLERYNKALLHEDGTLEHELATYMDAFFEGYNGKPQPPYHKIGSEDDITDILEQNDTYDTLEDALYDYCKAHEDMSKKDYATLAKAADAMAFYAYQNYRDPQKLVASYIQHIQNERPNADTLKDDILKNIQHILKVNREVGVSEQTIEKALHKVRKEILDLPKAKQPSR